MIAVRSSRVLIRRSQVFVVALGLVASTAVCAGAANASPKLPEIRLSRQNVVPACVTPERLMAYLQRRNSNLSPRFRDIATYYKRHGETWGVRWDYAFFQMAIETNFLTYRAPSGRMGDVDPKQNNFAGIGTTGGGVPGDSFPDVSTGVLGQIQHLVVYSGEMIPNPVAQRTQLKQEHILEKSRQLARPVRFSDLAKRWAADPKYGGSIEWVAERFRSEYCPRGGPQQTAPRQDIEVLPWQQKPPARATGGGHASASTSDESSPVRTVWSRTSEAARDAAKTTSKTAKAPARETRPAKVVASTVKVLPVQPVAPVEPVATATVLAAAPVADAEPTVSLPSKADEVSSQASAGNEPESSFALFTPPAALASATVPESPRRAAAETVDAPSMAVQESQTLAGPPKPPAAYVAVSTSMSPPAALTSEQTPEAPANSETPGPGPLATLLGAGSTGGAASKPNFDPPSGLGVKPSRCVVETARYGGDTTVLVKSPHGAKLHYIALSVIDGFEDSMTKSFLSSRGEGGEVLGTFPTREQALVQARTLCPAG